MWKDAPESRIHGEVPDCVEGGFSLLEEGVAEPAEPVAASRRRRRAISCSVNEVAEVVEAAEGVEEVVEEEAPVPGEERRAR